MVFQYISCVHIGEVQRHIFTCPSYSTYETQVEISKIFKEKPLNFNQWKMFSEHISTYNKSFVFYDGHSIHINEYVQEILFNDQYTEVLGNLSNKIHKSCCFFDYYTKLSSGPKRTKKALEELGMEVLPITYKSAKTYSHYRKMYEDIFYIIKNNQSPFRRFF